MNTSFQFNDAKNFILFLYETLHKELNIPNLNNIIINSNNIPNELNQFKKKYYSQNCSIISKIFFYEQSNILKCQNCNFEKHNYNSMNIIEFPLETVRLYKQNINPNGFSFINLYDCFDYNQQPRIQNGANQIYCMNCLSNANALSYNKLCTCPEVFTIILNRGKNFDLQIEFSFPMNIYLDKYVLDKTDISSYNLIGVITYVSQGHFAAYCQSPINGEWYYYDDNLITKCNNNIESLIQTNAYILFYHRGKKNCISFIYEGTKGYLDYFNDNKLLNDAYNEFRNLNLWAPIRAILFLMNKKMKKLNPKKSLLYNGIDNGDTIFIKKYNEI